MGDTKRVFVINRSLRSEHIRIFPTIKAMCEIMNKEYKSKAYDSVTLKEVLFNMNALRSLNWKHPQKYKGHTIRQIGVERVPKEGETHLDFASGIMEPNGIEGPLKSNSVLDDVIKCEHKWCIDGIHNCCVICGEKAKIIK